MLKTDNNFCFGQNMHAKPITAIFSESKKEIFKYDSKPLISGIFINPYQKSLPTDEKEEEIE